MQRNVNIHLEEIMALKKKKIDNLVIIFCLVGLVIIYFSNYDSFVVHDVEQKAKDDNLEEQVSRVSVVLVGDNLIHKSIYLDASLGNNEYDFRKMYELIKQEVLNYDIAYYNQETILGGKELGVSDWPNFNSPYEVGDAMIDAGFNLVSLATNHTMDSGVEAVLNSRAYWDRQEGVLAVGSYASVDDRNKIRIGKKNDISYTLLNYTYGTNGIPVPFSYLVNVWPCNGDGPDNDSSYQAYKEQVKNDIEMVRDKVDVLMVAMHWGEEYTSEPTSYQKDMAHYLASLGVDVIIGTHPHVIQPIEWIGDTLVIYSLGNFISAHEVVNMGNRVGLLSSLDVIKSNDGIKIEHLENELLYTYYTNQYADFLVIPFSELNEDYLSNYRDVYDKYKSVVQKFDSSIHVLGID